MKSSPIIKAFFVTFLWSTSWILIKLGIDNIPPLLFAGMRYFIAFFVLFLITYKHKPLTHISKRGLYWASLYGLVLIALTQGAQYVALSLLPTILVSLSLNAAPIMVALLGYVILKEKLVGLQWLGMGLYVIGILAYFYPFALIEDWTFGLVVAGFLVAFNVCGTIIGRYVNLQDFAPASQLTMIMIGVGSIILLGVGIMIEPWPIIGYQEVLILLWLGVINTALAFTLWNQALTKITAVSASLINSTMMIQIALMAWVFLQEDLSIRQWISVLIVFLGVVLVQVFRQQNRS